MNEIEKKGINYSNLEKHINEILLYIKDKINVDKIELPDKLITSNFINPLPKLTKSNIVYNDECFLIPLRIMDLIKEYTFKNNKISIKPNKIFSIDNNIYIIDSRKIIFGNINDELLFIAKYIFSYDSKDILEKEKDEIYSNTIIEYIQKRDCNQNDPNIQKLKTNKNKKIGDFIILNKDSKAINSNSNEISDNPLLKKITNIKRFTKKEIYHSKYFNKNNYSKEENNESQEIEENKDSNENEYDRIKSKYKSNNLNVNDRLYKNLQIADENALEIQNNLNNELLLEDLQAKIKEIEEDNKNKEIELNKAVNILNEKEKIIQKINEDNKNIKNELENLKKNNNDIIKENKILLNNLEKNKEEIKKKKMK